MLHKIEGQTTQLLNWKQKYYPVEIDQRTDIEPHCMFHQNTMPFGTLLTSWNVADFKAHASTSTNFAKISLYTLLVLYCIFILLSQDTVRR